ncbi:MAG: FtsX-like permease family protein [Desulfobacterales bacterium]|nr:FtsX-like permease family protein [Desulfobacterales bacterium]
MKIKSLMSYALQDMINPRGRYELFISILMIAFAAGVLALLSALSSGTDKMVDASFKRARPIMGVLVVSPRRSDEFTSEQIDFLTQLPRQEPRIETLSLIAERKFANEFWIYKADNKEKIMDVSINAVNYCDPMLNPEFGVTYYQGSPFCPFKDIKDKWKFGAIINARFLDADNLGYSAKEIKAFINGEKPFSLTIEPANTIGPDSIDFHPGKITIPITGIYYIEDPLYPDLFFSHDVAEAYYNTDKGWQPSYILQFFNFEEKHLLPYQWTSMEDGNMLVEKSDSSPDKEDKFTLPGKDWFGLPKREALPVNTYSKKLFKVNYKKVLLWIRDYKKEQESNYLKEMIGSHDTFGKQLRVRPPDVTLTQALRRINGIINVFVTSVGIILIVLCSASIIFFGMGHVHRKKRDLGLLRACGMSAGTAGGLFILQIFLICLVATILGILTGYIAAEYLEPFMDNLVNEHFRSGSEVLKSQIDSLELHIGVKNTGLTCLLVFIASIFGAIIPTIMAMKVDPMDQLRTQL